MPRVLGGSWGRGGSYERGTPVRVYGLECRAHASGVGCEKQVIYQVIAVARADREEAVSAQGLGVRDLGLGRKAEDSELRVKGLGLRVQGAGLRVEGVELRDSGNTHVMAKTGYLLSARGSQVEGLRARV